MKRFGSISFLSLFLHLSLFRVTVGEGEREHASLPPRGWNSYDSFCWTISEEEFLESAEIVSKRLLPHGYQYVVVDYLWYRRKVPGAYVDSLGFDVIDEWGRMQPDPERWPSSKGGKGFTEVAKKVHDMGLKFGIHVMRGISTQAFHANSLVLDIDKGCAYEESGQKWRAQDIGLKEKTCAWMQHGFMSVNTKLGAGRAFLKSLYRQYAEWGVDFVKHDCVFGDDLNIEEITIVSEILKELDRPILYSLSPGTSVTPVMAKEVSKLVNMYRITGDDWDTWQDVDAHFDVTRDMAASHMIGAKGLQGKSWPDLDMLPLGWLTNPGANIGPHRACKLTLDEQRTQVTLWAMAKSPLMFGGDVRKLEDTTFDLITNPTLLEINSYSANNMEFGCRDEKISYNQLYGGKVQLLMSHRTKSCLGASPNRKLTSKDYKRGSLSSCESNANQMWELHSNGTLQNSYSGLCAVINPVKENVGPAGVRSWIATGRKGEVYVAFFNLNPFKTTVSTKISDLAEALPDKTLDGASCESREVWTGKEFGVTKDLVSMTVETHGCALFILNCSQAG